MVSALDLIEHMQNGLKWVLGGFASYLSTMGEVIGNTFESVNFPEIMRFSFNFRQNKTYRSMEKWFHKNAESLLIALACSVMIFCTVKIFCWCFCRRSKRSHSASRPPQSQTIRRKEACRWFNQAEYDVKAAQNDMNVETPAYEWVCFKCQQASEKAIKAAVIYIHGSEQTKDTHDFSLLCELLGDSALRELANSLRGQVGDVSRMRYPDVLPYPKVPRDVYSEQQATEAWDIAQDIVDHVRQHYMD